MWMIESTQDRALRQLADLDNFEHRARYQPRWSVWPRRCYRTRIRVWGPAVCAEAVWNGPGDAIMERRWLHRDAYLIMMLKGTSHGTV